MSLVKDPGPANKDGSMWHTVSKGYFRYEDEGIEKHSARSKVGMQAPGLLSFSTKSSKYIQVVKQKLLTKIRTDKA